MKIKNVNVFGKGTRSRKKKIIAISLCLILVAAGLSGCGKTTKVSSKNPVIADGLCKINVTGETNLPGNFFLSFVFSRNLIMLDGKGNIVWSKHEEQPYEGATTGFWDFKKHIIDGKTYYSYHDQTGKFDDYGLTGYAPGERVILDENFNEVKRITAEESSVTPKGQGIDGHDFYMFDLDHYICSVYIKDNVKNIPGYPEGSNVIYSYLQEVQNGKVVWEFKSIDYPEIYDIVATDATPNANDFANKTIDAPDINHFNAMRVDNDGNLICSFRHLDTIMCLDRTRGDNQIRWKMSGKADEFGLTELQKTSGQHYVTLDENKITVFDNNNRDKQTEVRSYVLDIPNRKVNLVKSIGFNNKFSQACGSVQMLDNNMYVIGWGWATTDNECMSVYNNSKDDRNEKKGENDKVMSVTLDNPKDITYRAVYYD